MCDESKTILNAESQRQLNKEHEDLLRETLKLLFIKNSLLELKHLLNKDEDIARALKILRVQEFLRLDKNDDLLNLGDCSVINLSYTSQKSLHKMLEEKMKASLHSIAPHINTLKVKLPHLLEKKQNADSTMILVSPESTEILTLDLERRECFIKLAELHCKKLKLLKEAIELKLATAVTEKAEVLHLEMSINQTKANLLRDYMISDFINSSENTFQAVQLVEKHINEKIDKEETKKSDKKV